MPAVALLRMLSPNYALAEQVTFNDSDIIAEYIAYASPNGAAFRLAGDGAR